MSYISRRSGSHFIGLALKSMGDDARPSLTRHVLSVKSIDPLKSKSMTQHAPSCSEDCKVSYCGY